MVDKEQDLTIKNNQNIDIEVLFSLLSCVVFIVWNGGL
jgi:hypothetical protein